MQSTRVTTVLTYAILSLAGIFSFSLPKSLVPSSTGMVQAPAEVMKLSGVIRDFSSDHPDFANIDVGDMGHHAGNVSQLLSNRRKPVFTNAGQQVTSEWFDKDGNPIAPYEGPGLAGGHFDVDVYVEPTTKRKHHTHEFDDKYDITYVDIFSNPLLKGSDFDGLVGPGYPNNLRLEFINEHNGGGGSYTFEAGAGLQTGTTADGFTTTFDPALLTQFRVSFVTLAYMRHTNPGNVKSDPIDRDDSFHIRMYDVVTDEMVYEIALYHHYKNGNAAKALVQTGKDACGVKLDDQIGSYGDPGDGGITDSGSFDQWFSDELGTNQATAHTVSLQRDDDGVYEFFTNDFFPIDDRLMGNEGDDHNNFFTYTISASFTYDECTSQFFEFASNDDAWVYIDNSLAIDLGGTATTQKQYVDLDRLGLVDGNVYTLSFFFAHRRDVVNSLFHMRTNIQLNTGTLSAIAGFYD